MCSTAILRDEDPHDIEKLLAARVLGRFTQHPDLTLMGVLSALEMACWDIIGKEAGQPVYKLLGGRVHERLRTYTYIYARPGDRTDVYIAIRISRPSAPPSTWRRGSRR